MIKKLEYDWYEYKKESLEGQNYLIENYGPCGDPFGGWTCTNANEIPEIRKRMKKLASKISQTGGQNVRLYKIENGKRTVIEDWR